MRALARALGPSLESLDLRENRGISDDGVGELARALPRLPALRRLYLHTTRFRDAQPLAEALPQALEVLDLGGNRICEGGLALARLVGECPSLLYLNLSGIGMGPRDFEALAATMRQQGAFQSLQVLDISCRYMRGAELDDLVQAFRAGACPRLEVLRAMECGINDETAQVLVDTLRESAWPALRRLDLRFNDMSDAMGKALVEAGGSCEVDVSKRYRYSWLRQDTFTIQECLLDRVAPGWLGEIR